MPRKTHPSVRSKHTRAHIRYQRHAWANKRFNRAKRIYGDYDTYPVLKDENGQIIRDNSSLDVFVHPNVVRANPRRYASFFFSRTTSEWSKNWQTYCSCLGCSKHHYDPIPRAVTDREWKDDWEDEMNELF